MSTTTTNAALAASPTHLCQYCQETTPEFSRAHQRWEMADTCDTCLYYEVTIRWGRTKSDRDKARRLLRERTKEVAL